MNIPKYRVEIHGENFLIDLEGHVAKHGFITWRYLEAHDPAAAENAAVQTIREVESLRELVRNSPSDPPGMDVIEIVELDSFEGVENLEPGFIWYEQKPKRWWQFWKRLAARPR